MSFRLYKFFFFVSQTKSTNTTHNSQRKNDNKKKFFLFVHNHRLRERPLKEYFKVGMFKFMQFPHGNKQKKISKRPQDSCSLQRGSVCYVESFVIQGISLSFLSLSFFSSLINFNIFLHAWRERSKPHCFCFLREIQDGQRHLPVA